MTEADAKTKWCFAFTASHTDPRAREYLPTDEDPLGGASGPFRHHCIGSACMAWRPTFEDRGIHGVKPTGFCGLAGKQQ